MAGKGSQKIACKASVLFSATVVKMKLMIAKLPFVFGTCTLCTLMFLAFLGYERALYIKSARSMSAAAVASLDPEDVKRLASHRITEREPFYHHVQSRLRALRLLQPGIRSVYLLTIRNSSLSLLVHSGIFPVPPHLQPGAAFPYDFEMPIENHDSVEAFDLVPRQYRADGAYSVYTPFRIKGNLVFLVMDFKASRLDWLLDLCGDETAPFQILFLTALGFLLIIISVLAVRSRDAVYRKMFEDTNAIMLLVDPQSGTIVDANPSACQFYNYSRGAIRKFKISQINISSPDEVQSRLHEISSGVRRRFESRHRTSEGKVYDVVVQSIPLVVRGHPLLFSIITDVTAQKEAEMAHRAEEEKTRGNERRLRLVLEATNDGFWDWNNTTGEVFYSDGLITMLGYTREEFIPSVSTWRSLVHPQDLARVEGVLQEHLQHKTDLYSCEHRLRKKDGTWLWILDRGQLVECDDNGTPRRTVGSHSNIQERHEAADARDRYTAYLQAIFDNFPYLVWMKDGEGRFLVGNTAFTESCKLDTPVALIGKTDFDVWPADLAASHIADDRIVLESKRKKQVEERVTVGSEIRWFETYKSPILNSEGQAIGTVGCTRDISDRKDAETKITEARIAAVRANKAKSEFLASVSHEIRVPMAGVVGMAQLLTETALSQEQQEYVETIKTSAEALLVILNDIFDFSKMETGRLIISPSAFSFKELVRRVIAVNSSRAEEKTLQIVNTVEDSLPEFLMGDSLRIGQVLINLLRNAIKFSPTCSSITIRSFADSHAGKHMVHFIVADTGIGIAEDRLEIIFEAFPQAETKTFVQANEMGLDLPISKQLVELMGGKIWVESQLGAGSTFHVLLPLTPALHVSQQKEDTPPCHSAPIRSLHILLAEDNPAYQKITRSLLEKAGHNVRIVDNGKDAVERYQTMDPSQAFDVIFMDCQMPGLNGLEATRCIRQVEVERHTHVPIIALTAYAEEGGLEKCLEAGMDEYLSKPIDHSQLTLILARIAHRKFTQP